jgi:hypothetical protein
MEECSRIIRMKDVVSSRHIALQDDNVLSSTVQIIMKYHRSHRDTRWMSSEIHFFFIYIIIIIIIII